MLEYVPAIWLTGGSVRVGMLAKRIRSMAGRVLALPLAYLARLPSGDHLRDLRHHQGLAWYQLGTRWELINNPSVFFLLGNSRLSPWWTSGVAEMKHLAASVIIACPSAMFLYAGTALQDVKFMVWSVFCWRLNLSCEGDATATTTTTDSAWICRALVDWLLVVWILLLPIFFYHTVTCAILYSIQWSA